MSERLLPSKSSTQRAEHGEFILHNQPPTKYCGGKLTGLQLLLISLSVFIATVLIVVFAGGRILAKHQLRTTDLDVSMHVTSLHDDSFDVRIVGTLNNRGFAATLKEATLDLVYENSKFGTVEFPALEIAASSYNDLDISSSVKVVDMDAFSAFSIDLIQLDELETHLSGSISASSMGITFAGLPLDLPIILRGAGNFQSPAPVVRDTRIVAGADQTLQLTFVSELMNSASVTFANVGQLDLTLLFEDKVVGSAKSDHAVALSAGLNVVNFTGFLTQTEDNQVEFQKLLSQYANGVTAQIAFTGNEQSTPFALLLPAFQALRASTSLDGLFHLEERLFRVVYGKFDALNILSREDPINCSYTGFFTHYYMDIFLFGTNPLDTTAHMRGIDATIYWAGPDGTDDREVAYAFGPISLKIEPGEMVVYKQRLCLVSLDKIQNLSDLLTYLGNVGDTTGVAPTNLFFTARGDITFDVDNFKNLTISYVQEAFNVVAQLAPET